MNRIALVGLITVLAYGVCAEERKSPSAEAVLASLDAHCGILTEEIFQSWIEAGIEPYRRGLAAIESGPERVRRLDSTAAARRVRKADVVLVADLHQYDPARRAFARAVKRFSDAEARKAGRVAVALESVPLASERAVVAARKTPITDGVDPLSATLASLWPWPVAATTELLRDRDLASVPLLGAGRKSVSVAEPATPDAARRPGLGIAVAPKEGEDAEREFPDWKYGGDFYRGNRNAHARVTKWIRAKSGRRVFVLYGAAHYLGKGNLVESLEKAGLSVVVLVPFLPEWEAALRRRDGVAAATGWYEVAPNVFRPPLVTDDEILAIPLPNDDE